jgi:hypothetical protein
MIADDKAGWAQRLIELGLSQKEIARRSSIPHQVISHWLIYKREKDQGVSVLTNQPGDEGMRKSVYIAEALKDDLEAKRAVATKASSDNLA